MKTRRSRKGKAKTASQCLSQRDLDAQRGGGIRWADRRYCQREEEEKKRLISIMRSDPGHYHTRRFRQLLCPDLSCKICNSVTAEVNQLLFPDGLEDATSSASPLASRDSLPKSSSTLSSAFSAVSPGDTTPAPLPEPFPPPPRILSPNPLTSLGDFLSASPLGHSLPTQPFLPLGSEFPTAHSPPPLLAFFPLPPHDTLRVDPLPQAEATLTLNTILLNPTFSRDISPLPDLSQTMNRTDSSACRNIPPMPSTSLQPPECIPTVPQSKSISKPVPENSSPESLGHLSNYIPTVTGTDHSSPSNSDVSWWQACAEDSFPSTLAQCDFDQESHHSIEASFQGDPAAERAERGHLFSLRPDVQTLLQRQVQKNTHLLMWNKKEKKRDSFPKQVRSDSNLSSSGKLLDSTADKHDSAAALPYWSSKGKPKELHGQQQASNPQTREDQLEQNRIQLSCGLLSLHSGFLSSADHVLGDYSSVFLSNKISNASIGQELPVLFNPLPEVQPQPLPQTLPQAHLQSPPSILPSNATPQTRNGEMHFHRPRNESDPLASSEIQNLEWNVLQKQQEGLCGSPSVAQRSSEDFDSSAPNLPHYQPSQAHVSVSVQPENYPLNNELNKNLEHHLRKRLIQHRWGLLRRIHKSLLLMRPPRDCSKESERKSDHGLPCVSVVKGQSSKNLNVGLSQPESFYERDSEMLQLEKDEGKDKANGPENDPKDHLLSDSQNSSGKDLGSDSEKDLDSHMVNLSGENPVVSGPSVCLTQLENVSKVHLSKKIKELNEGQLPGPAQNSWHTINQTLTPHVESHPEMKQRSLQPSVGRDYTVNTSQELSFIGPRTQQMLDAHVKELYMKALEDTSFHSKLFSSTNLISEVDFKSGGFASIRGSSKSVHGDKMGTAHSASVLDHPLPVTSHMNKEEKGALRHSLSSIHQELAVDRQRITDARQTQLLVTHSITGKTSQTQDLLVNRCPPKLPAGQAGARHEPKGKRESSSDRIEMQQGNKMNKSEPVPVPYMSRETFTAESMDDLQSSTFDVLTSSEPVISQRTNVNDSKGETTVSTESPPANISVLQEPKSLDLKKQILSELKSALENRVHGRTQGQASDMSLASDSLTYKASLTPAQGVSSVDVGASQVLHVHLKDSMGQRQDTWAPKHDLRWCREKNFPPADKRVSPPGPKSEELGGGDARLGTSQPRKKTLCIQNMEPQEESVVPTVRGAGSKSPPESLFKKQMKHFFQWLHPGIKRKKQENSQKKTRVSSDQSRGPDKSRVALTGTPRAQIVMTGSTKFPEGKVGPHRAACPQGSYPFFSGKFRKTQHKVEACAQAQPAQGHRYSCRIPSSKVTDTSSHQQQAVLACCCIRQIRDKNSLSQTATAFKQHLLCQKHPQSVARRETVHRPYPTCGLQAGQGLPTARTTAGGTVFGDLCLLFRQEALLQNFQGKKFHTP
ncbi:spermatogenesis-associated protein 31D3-like [Rousettus aegyptiacus]|uniref:spermatogenesis-associated protein 31D3-like n=1 Tax=Rousettus aegyptiacus TaxID=9407 RepID=UPI00168D1AA1|nr:spermatogenesis-associated protein 31D3-like [Rousettus aegyptiacus]